jgi:hypothetical protein
MADRRILDDELNRITQMFQDTDNNMKKIPGSEGDRTKLRELFNNKKAQLLAEHGDDLQKLNLGKSINVGKATTSGAKNAISETAQSGGGKLMKMIGKKAGALALGPVGALASGAYDALNTEALADSTDGGLDPEQQVNVQAMRDLQQTGEMTPDRFARVRSMVKAPSQSIGQEAPEEEQIDNAPIPANRANALTGVDNQLKANDMKLQNDLISAEGQELDPQAEKNLKIRKLFQGQIR